MTTIVIIVLSAIVWIKSCQGILKKKTIKAAEIIAEINLAYNCFIFGLLCKENETIIILTFILFLSFCIYIFTKILSYIAKKNIDKFYKRIEEEKNEFWRRS